MAWTRLTRNPTGSREGPKPLASAAFENEACSRISVGVYASHQYTPEALRPGLRLEWSFKQKGSPLVYSSDDPFLTWPVELLPELLALLQKAADATTGAT